MINTADTTRALMAHLRAALPSVRFYGPGQAFRRPVPAAWVQVIPREWETDPVSRPGREDESLQVELRCYTQGLRERDHEDDEDDPLSVFVDGLKAVVDCSASPDAVEITDSGASRVGYLHWGPTRELRDYGLALETIGVNDAINVDRSTLTATGMIQGCSS